MMSCKPRMFIDTYNYPVSKKKKKKNMIFDKYRYGKKSMREHFFLM